MITVFGNKAPGITSVKWGSHTVTAIPGTQKISSGANGSIEFYGPVGVTQFGNQTLAVVFTGCDLSPAGHPAMGRVPVTFEPTRLGGPGARRSAYSVGVRLPSALCGRYVVVIVLPSRQDGAGLGERCANSVSLRSSSGSRPLKLSMKAFWVGLPGAM